MTTPERQFNIHSDTEQDIMQAVTDALMDTVHEQLESGMDQQAIWEACRDHLHETFGFPLRAAANLTRMIFCVIADRIEGIRPYNDDEIEGLHNLVNLDISAA